MLIIKIGSIMDYTGVASHRLIKNMYVPFNDKVDWSPENESDDQCGSNSTRNSILVRFKLLGIINY